MSDNSNQISTILQNYMTSYGNLQKKQWNYYIGNKDYISIYNTKPASTLKASTHTQVHIDFMGDIIDLKQGYMGERITIKYNGDSEELAKNFDMMKLKSQMKTLNSQTIEYTSVEGLSHRLVYTEDGQFKSKNLHGWQVVYDYTNNIFNPDKAYYFYSVKSLKDIDATNFCQVYDRENVYYYEQVKEKKGPRKAQTNNTITYKLNKTQPHNFNQVPIVPFMNTSNWEGNCVQALDSMDAYDSIISDTTGEIKAARLAYLKIYGDLYTGKDSEGNEIPISDYLKDFGTMMFGQTADGKPLGDAEFLEKNLDDTAIQNMLNKYRSHIYEQSGSVDLKELSSAERVFSIKASLMRLENNAMTTENYIKLGLLKVLDLWSWYINETTTIKTDIMDYDIELERVMPEDTANNIAIAASKAETLLKLSAVIDIKDALELAGIENATEIAERAMGIDKDNV